MLTTTLFNEPIYICNRDEARKLWKESPEKRARIWTEEESNACLLLDLEAIQGIVEMKHQQPGYVHHAPTA
jgi:hypothetical protein